MEESKSKLHDMVDSINDPTILDNLVIIVTDYVYYYSDQKQTSGED